jgi:hypothetical protein
MQGAHAPLLGWLWLQVLSHHHDSSPGKRPVPKGDLPVAIEGQDRVINGAERGRDQEHVHGVEKRLVGVPVASESCEFSYG